MFVFLPVVYLQDYFFGKCGKEGKKLQKFEYLENEKSFSVANKRFSVGRSMS